MIRWNPFSFFQNSSIYAADFKMWSTCLWKSMTGGKYNDRDYMMGVFDYLYFIIGLINVGCFYKNENFVFKNVLIKISESLSILKQISTLVFVIPLGLISLISYQVKGCIKQKSLDIILNMEVLPVDEDLLSILNYESDGTLSQEKIKTVFYARKSMGSRIHLRDHLSQLGLFQQENIDQRYVLRRLYLRDSTDAILYEDRFAILGLCPRLISYYSHGIDRANPIALIVPSRENKKELEAMQRIDAFGFSQVWDGLADLSSKITRYVIHKNIFLSEEDCRCTTALLSVALRAQAASPFYIDAINELVPAIFAFADMQPDKKIFDAFLHHPFFHPAPDKRPWISDMPMENIIEVKPKI